MNEYAIAIAFDEAAQKWYAINDAIPIALEDYSLDELMRRVKLAAPEMLEINNLPHAGVFLKFKVSLPASRHVDSISV